VLGEILPVHVERLRAMGEWLSVYGDSIYGTRAGVIAPATDGSTVSTCKGQIHYVHVLDYISDCVTLSDVPAGVKQSTLLKNGSSLNLTTRGENLVIAIPPQQRDLADTVIRLEM
jgi:alpha-L-fucosidase